MFWLGIAVVAIIALIVGVVLILKYRFSED